MELQSCIHRYLKNTELNNFYKLYPDKFNNKTNGITFRRWLIHCNHELADYITQLIGDGYKHDAKELKALMSVYRGSNCNRAFVMILRQHNKTALAKYLYDTAGNCY